MRNADRIDDPSEPARGSRAPLRSARLASAWAPTLPLLVVLAAAGARAQVAVPFSQSDLPLASLASEVSYTVALSSLPLRPELIAEVVPDDAHLDMSLQVEISGCTLVNSFGSCPAIRTSAPGTGPRSVSYEPYRCVVATSSPAYAGHTCNVRVRALDFGTAGAPATFDLAIRGVTEVPTSTISASLTTNPVETVALEPAKDTTLYQAGTSSSNGQGESFWSSIGTGSNQLRGLIAFDVASAVPANATIVDARLKLFVLSSTSSPSFDVHPVPRGLEPVWSEGLANAVGDESTPPAPIEGAATWSHRIWSSSPPPTSLPWSIPGGDFQSPSLSSGQVFGSGAISLTSPALVAHVAALHASSGLGADGLLFVPGGSGSVRFASGEHATSGLRPLLVVDFVRAPDPVSSNLPTSTASFVNEGQDFRWIYDLDHDDVLITPITGRCEVTNTGGNLLPYTYQYLGAPSYAGLDCCTWQIDSSTGVTGTGQAIFFINVDGSNPANQPPDLDVDGIKNLCDNCPGVPNGPLLGACTSGSKAGRLCRSSPECPGGSCSLAQDDLDLDGTGDACVPEPEAGAALAAGLLGACWLAGRRGRGVRCERS